MDTFKKVQVRFTSQEIYEKMVALAKEDNRSLNGEIMQAFREFIRRRSEKEENDDRQVHSSI